MRFFISSAKIDLSAYRNAVVKYLQYLLGSAKNSTGQIVAMEFFNAAECSSKEKCLEELISSDLVIGIYGKRYGSIDAESGKSMTELEFDCAAENKIPVLAFVQELDDREQEELNFIHSKVYKNNYVCAPFTNEKSLVDRLDASLHSYFRGIDGFSFDSIWSELRALQEQMQKNICGNEPGVELQLFAYEDDDAMKNVNDIIFSAKCLQQQLPGLHEEHSAVMNYAYNVSMNSNRITAQAKNDLAASVAGAAKVIRANWETLYLSLPNHLNRILLSSALLKLRLLQHRLLTERWTEKLRQEVLQAREECLDLAAKARIAD